MPKEQKAIKLLKDFTKMDFSNPVGWTGYFDTELKELQEAIETVLNILKEKDKQIDLMSEYIYNTQIECNVYYKNKEEAKEYYEKLAIEKGE